MYIMFLLLFLFLKSTESEANLFISCWEDLSVGILVFFLVVFFSRF